MILNPVVDEKSLFILTYLINKLSLDRGLGRLRPPNLGVQTT